jgi:protein TonB
MFALRTVLAALLVFASPTWAQGSRAVALISQNDYPAEAMRLGQQGTVRVRLRVSAEGRVMGCAVIQSASPLLDRATCRILTQRARFVPAKSINGEAIESEFEAPPIRWVLPKKRTAPQDARP